MFTYRLITSIFVSCFRMQQEQLAAQLAHHGGSARHHPPLSPTPSDSDSDISLGAHSPPMGSPGPLRFGSSSPTAITTFRFGPHSPGPMPAQFRFGNRSPPSFRLDRQSPTPPNYRLDHHKLRKSESPINIDTTTTSSYNNSAVNMRLSANESPIDVDSNNDYRHHHHATGGDDDDSPIRIDNSPTHHQTSLHNNHQHSPPLPPINLRIAEHMRMTASDSATKIETPLALRLGHQLSTTTPHQLAPLRIQVTSPNRLIAQPSPHTNLHIGGTPHSGIVRIAPTSPSNTAPLLHRPFSPPRLT